jgi:AcrR family transcriptional regulator
MRTKSELKRQSILTEAAAAFRELGVEGTSMSEIAARVGGSKATLYSYFSSKEELVLEILLAIGEQHGKTAFAVLREASDSRAGLKAFGVAYLQFITDPNTVAIARLAIAQADRTDLGRQFYERGPASFVRDIASYLQELVDKGVLADRNTTTMAFHLKGLYESEITERCLFGALRSIERDNFGLIADRAVDAFLDIYEFGRANQ